MHAASPKRETQMINGRLPNKKGVPDQTTMRQVRTVSFRDLPHFFAYKNGGLPAYADSLPFALDYMGLFLTGMVNLFPVPSGTVSI